MRYRFLLTIVLAAIAVKLAAQINRSIDEFVSDSVFRNAGISICLREAGSGDIIAGHNMNMALTSASLMKLITTSVALEILDPEYVIPTRIGYVGNFDPGTGVLDGYIIIKGGGDPTILSEYFPDHDQDIINAWAEAIHNHGIRMVTGGVIADASVFDYHPAAGSWEWSDLGNYYGAGAHGISIYDNMYRIHFNTGAEGSKPEITSTHPEIPGLLFDNRLISFGNKDNGYVYLEPYGNYAVLRGELPPGKDDFVLKAAIPDPPILSAGLLHKVLIGKGIKINEEATTLRRSPYLVQKLINAPKHVITVTFSPSIKEIVKITNNESVNLFAEHLLKYLVPFSHYKEHASKDEGLQIIRQQLERKLGDNDGLYITDGSGLSRSNAMSSFFITRYLNYMITKSRVSEAFVASLPKAGEEGTLEYYFRDPVFRENLIAKSGTSRRVRNYAGYFTTSDGKQMFFGILTNNFDCSSHEVSKRIEKLLKTIILEN